MRVMALDTTVRGGSVALVALIDGQSMVDERPGDASRTHAERLPAEMAVVVDAHGLSWTDIDLFAVASGPGSFTGLRIGIATVQGLALAAGRPMVAVSALEAMAQEASRAAAAGQAIATWMDARRGDVFAALYTATAAPLFDDERLVEIEAPTVGRPAPTLDRIARHVAGASILFVGDGAVLHSDSIARGWPSPAVTRPQPLLAGTIGRMALARAARGGTIHPSAVHPLYVRRPDAEVARDERASTSR